jgi:hypothetical protein
MPLFIKLTHKQMHIKSIIHSRIAMFAMLRSLAGFEPGYSVSEAEAMSTAPRRQGTTPFFAELLAMVAR